MNTRRCLRIAERINTQLVRGLARGIDPQRMLAESLYARDVLLVCDAHHGSDLASLAQHFRLAAAEPPQDSRHPSTWGAESTGFGASRPGGHSGFDAQSQSPAPRERTGAWFSPSRWLGK